MQDIWKLSATGLSAAFERGEVTPSEALVAYRDRIARLDPTLNCYTVLSEEAEAQAAESTARYRAGRPLSPIDGLPLAIKDSLKVAGMTAAWGSSVFADEVCAADELPVARLRAAGAVFLGKTNLPEFAVEGYTSNRLYGTTGNPWNPALTSGGSSGGSVSAVAAGLAAAAIGTDGGGSIRRPCSYTGLVGLKPTIGRVPRANGLPQLLLDFEVAGPVARTVDDARLLYSILAGPDRADPVSRGVPTQPPAGRPLKILYVEQFGDHPCAPEIRRSVRAAAGRLRQLGHQVTEGDMPFDMEALGEFWGLIAKVGLARLCDAVPAMRDKASPQYLEMAAEGAKVPASTFWAGLETIKKFRSEVSLAFAGLDLIMTPSCAAQPWPAGLAYPTEIDGRPVGPRGHAIYTGWVNACGHPAIAVPSEPDSDQMPVGFQLVGDLGSEEQLLQVAQAFAAAGGDGWQWPAIAAA